MKSKLLTLLTLALAPLFIHKAPAVAHEKAVCGRCEGGQCNVCTNCSRCQWCKSGGTCSICRSQQTAPSGTGGRSTTRRSYSPPPQLKMLPQEPTQEPSWIRQQRLERAEGLRAQQQTRTSTVAPRLVGKCIAVTDGDTLKILVGRTSTTIRLNGIDAPEKAQPFGTQSKNSLSSLAFGKTITVYSAGKDRYGRVLGWVFVGSTSVNSEQVKRGFAWWYRQYAPKEAKLAALETSARNSRVGLWRDPSPVAPWQWRSSRRRS